MTSIENKQELFLSSFFSVLDVDSETETLKKSRMKTWNRFLDIRPLTDKEENFKYVPLKEITSKNYEKATHAKVTIDLVKSLVLPECQNSYIVFINGFYNKELSDTSNHGSSFVLLPFKDAMKTYNTLLTNNTQRLIKDEKDPFVLLTASCYQDGAFFYLPPNIELTQPIQILNIHSENTQTWVMPRFFFFCGTNSHVTLINTSHYESSKEELVSVLYEYNLEEQSSIKLVDFDLEKHPESGWNFSAFRIFQKKNSVFKATQVQNSSKTRRDWKIILLGENANCALNGIWLLKSSNEGHTNVVIEHTEPYCESLQYFKGVLDDSAHSSFQGKIIVQKKAQKTQAYQLNNNLLLSSKAQSFSKPGLEIFADDVKASHGSTTGNIDQEQLFYLRTRGFSEQEARNCLLSGFCFDIFATLPTPSLINKAKNYILRFRNT